MNRLDLPSGLPLAPASDAFGTEAAFAAAFVVAVFFVAFNVRFCFLAFFGLPKSSFESDEISSKDMCSTPKERVQKSIYWMQSSLNWWNMVAGTFNIFYIRRVWVGWFRIGWTFGSIYNRCQAFLRNAQQFFKANLLQFFVRFFL